MELKIRTRSVLPYLLPALVVVGIFYIYPIIFTVPVSMMKWDGITSMKLMVWVIL